METVSSKIISPCECKENGHFYSKYHRKEPICSFSPSQTLYDLVRSNNADKGKEYYASYLGRSITFAQLFSDTDKLASALYADGIRRDQIVGVCLLTTPEVCSVLLSINKIGAVSYWMDASLKPTDLQQYIVKLGIEIAIIYEPLVPAFLQIQENTKLKKIIVVPSNPFSRTPILSDQVNPNLFVDFYNYIQQAPDVDIPPSVFDKRRTTVIVQSSGSTGKSKSIAHTDYNFNSAILKMAYCDLPFYRQNRALVCAPPWVVYGLVNSIYSGLVLGIQTIFSIQPKEDMIYRFLGQFDYVYGVPVYIRFLYAKIVELQTGLDKCSKKELSRIYEALRAVDVFISGGDKIAEEELLAWQITFDKAVINGYGNNEVTGAVIVSPRFANRPGSIGIPMYDVCLKVFDNESGAMLPNGQTGELCIHSDALFEEYYHDPITTGSIKQVHEGKAWVHTGDLATIDQDGFVFLLGRTRRLIIDKLGYKISPENSENLIMSMEGVIECVVVGAERTENDTVPVAFVELKTDKKKDTSMIDSIEKLCCERLKDYERPKFFFEIPAIPHKENGGKRDILALEKLAQKLITTQKC